MAEVLISPGVLTRENDQSSLATNPIAVGAAIIGPTVRGKVNLPTVVTSYSEYTTYFGSTFLSASDSLNSFFTSIAAYNYFQNGGRSLLITRVASGSFAPASSSISSHLTSGVGAISATGSFTFTSDLTDANDGAVEVVYGGTTYYFEAKTTPLPSDVAPFYYFDGSADETSDTTTLSTKMGSILTGWTINPNGAEIQFTASAGAAGNGTTIATGSVGDFATQVTLGGGAAGASSVSFELETLSEGAIMNNSGPELSKGALTSGSRDNIRWEVLGANTSSGVFSLAIRRGDDGNRTKSVLETFYNLSLDPYQDNYISKVIGDYRYTLDTTDSANPYFQITGSYPNKSRYVTVKNVNLKTPQFFDGAGNAKAEYTSSIPVNSSGAFAGGTGEVLANNGNLYEKIGAGTQGVTSGNYTTAINLHKNATEFKFNVIVTPGLTYEETTHATQLDTLITNIEDRGDAMVVVDLMKYGSTIGNAKSQAATLDSSYAATYYPWVLVRDFDLNQGVWVPASTLIPAVIAASDNASEPWFAPAGISRGGMQNVLRAEKRLTQGNRDDLYSSKINPIATFPTYGVVVYGQKTLQSKSSALDRINVRRLLIEIKSQISKIADTLVFDQNTPALRNQFLAQVNPYLESVQQRRGVYAFKVVMDESNNSAEVIDRNQLFGAIYIQPTKTAEFIYLDFNILPTGATFPTS